MLPEAAVSRTTCRSCNSKNLAPILSLGNPYVSSFVHSPLDAHTSRVPLEIVLCDLYSGGCGLLQLKHTVPPEQLYKKYWYRSFINDSMRAALADITAKAERLVELSPGDLVLDIGCNDGTLLRSYRLRGLRLVGFEPAENLMRYAEQGTTSIINTFFNAADFRNSFPDGKAKIITSIAMFYDLEDPNTFVSDIVECLDNDGVWIIQMSYLPSMLEQNAFDNICHEHLEYYSFMSLKNLITKYELEIFDVELNDVNGGSFRVYLKHPRGRVEIPDSAKRRIETLDAYEYSVGLYDVKIYNEFAERINDIKRQLYDLIIGEVERGKTVYGYGASTKGNTLLQVCGLDVRLIKAVADRNPDKWGYMTIGSSIPIIAEEEARLRKPDYFLILPWHFLNYFVQREKKYLDSGGRFIVPLPKVEVVSSGLRAE